MYKKIKIPTHYMPEVEEKYGGAFSFLTRDEKILDIASKIFGRYGENFVVKIFHQPLQNSNIEQYLWGRPLDPNYKKSMLLDSLLVQNLASLQGLAPRAYGVFILQYEDQEYACVLLDDCGDITEKDKEMQTEVFTKLTDYLDTIKCRHPFYDMGQKGNVVGGKWVDFQGSIPTEQTSQLILSKVEKSALWAGNCYQSVGSLSGFRKTDQRVKDLGLDRIDFMGKTVLDVGCSAGMFCIYAHHHGAKRVVGVDLPEVIEASRELAILTKAFNVDYLGLDYNDECIDCNSNQFDIVLYLSVYRYFGYTNKTHKRVKDIMIFEQNGDDSDEEVRNKLQWYFGKVELIGKGSDFDNRNIYHCTQPLMKGEQ